MPTAPYTCALCDAPASIVDGAVVRSCAHADSAVIAHMDAVAYGESHTEGIPDGAPASILARMWQKIFGGQGPLSCVVCGAPAVIKNGRTLRACAHVEAGVTHGRV